MTKPIWGGPYWIAVVFWIIVCCGITPVRDWLIEAFTTIFNVK